LAVRDLADCKEKQTVNAVVVERTEPTPLPVAAGPLDRIADLLVRGVTPEQLGTYLDVQHKYEAEQARRAYHAAMAAFKAEPIEPIKKTKTVKFKLKPRDGQTEGREMSYKQETLAQVVRAAIPALARNGLSHAWDVKQEQAKVIAVSCVMTHQAGHSERVTLFGLPDESGQKNPLQQIRSTITYLQRATLLLITGLAAEDGSDDDGRGAYTAGESAEPRTATGFATAKQQAFIKRKAKSDDALAAALADIGVNTTAEIPFDKVNDVLAALEK
jgi:hypothetical protein